ncbi:MAG TPA: flippase [Nitrospiria bacterium]|nr:flippase [Nitrospiria bacterium]
MWVSYLPQKIRSRLEGRNTLQKVASNTGWLLADKVLRMGVGLVVMAWVARYLGPDRFGIYNYAVAFVALFSAVSALGLDPIVVRDILRDPEHTDETLGTAFLLKLMGGTSAFLISVCTMTWLRPTDSLTRWLVGLIAAGLIVQAFDSIDFWFQSQIQSKYTVYAKSAAFFLANIGKIVLVMLKAPLIAFACVGLAEIAIGATGLIAVNAWRGRTLKNWRWNAARARQLLRDGWPLSVSGIVILIYMRIDQVMLGELATNRDVGNFSAAVQLVEAWYFIPMIISTSLFPVIVESKKLDKTVYEARIQRLYDLMIWIAIGLALLVSILSRPVVSILFGPEYGGAAPVLSLQAWMAAAVFFGVARQQWLTSEGHLKDGMLFEIAAVLLNVGCNMILIPAYGAIGAASASLITAYGANLLVAVYSRPIRRSVKMYLVSLTLPMRFIKRLCAA